ncbi:MAG: protoheme IX farnesyltransferase [Bacteriovoracaceae bacterium]|nr:protoheme IX farnesyltransferase [Bacteriovoracaceae bacterium]
MSIVRFVVISAIAGYFIGFEVEDIFSWTHFLMMTLGVFFISSGSLSLNQIQEIEADSKMPRTQNRPVANGQLSYKLGLSISLFNIFFGAIILYFVSPLSMIIGLIIIFLYNVLYTMYWKKKWAFAAVPGAIPGALPCTIGFAAINNDIFSSQSIYLFLIMFLWQMPHFWTLAIKLKEDYAKGGFPVLPVVMGKSRTLYHITYYVAAYVLLAVLSPAFIDYHYFYYFIVLPFAILVVGSFIFFLRSSSDKAWLPFFIIVNFSMLAFIFVPVLDKWYPVFFNI